MRDDESGAENGGEPLLRADAGETGCIGTISVTTGGGGLFASSLCRGCGSGLMAMGLGFVFLKETLMRASAHLECPYIAVLIMKARKRKSMGKMVLREHVVELWYDKMFGNSVV